VKGIAKAKEPEDEDFYSQEGKRKQAWAVFEK
jgi:hypothetical protein